jgi:hypothetical protein
MSRIGRELRSVAFVSATVWVMLAAAMAAIGFMDAANGVADWSDLPAASC